MLEDTTLRMLGLRKGCLVCVCVCVCVAGVGGCYFQSDFSTPVRL